MKKPREIKFIGNWAIDITASGRGALDVVCELALKSGGLVGTAVAFRDFPATKTRPRTLVVYWSDNADQVTKFPFELNPTRLASVIDGWLCSLRAMDQLPAPDIDGSVEPGAFRAYSDHRDYGSNHDIDLSFSSYAIFAIQPVWAEYHK